MNATPDFRDRIAAAWKACQSAKGKPAEETKAFQRYCEVLYEASQHAVRTVPAPATNTTDSNEGVSVMKVALRVLVALDGRRAPDDADLSILRRRAPEVRHLGADELACEVIQRELAARTRLRAPERGSASGRCAF